MSARVKKGAAWLDTQDPGWASHIVLTCGTFSMGANSVTDGVLGQLYGYFGRGPNGMPICGKEGKAVTTIDRLGFDVPESEESPEAYEALTAAWRREIRDRVAS